MKHKVELIALVGIVGLALLHPIASRAVTIRDDQPDSGYLSLGANPEYAAVGLFVNSWGYTGAGTLIAPDWVLTAAHNLSAASSGTFTINGMDYNSTELFRHPGWTGNALNGYDIGLVHLSSPVSSSLAPATLYTGSSEFGQVATFVGIGLYRDRPHRLANAR